MNCIIKLVKGYFMSFVLFFALTFLISILIKFTFISEGSSIYYLIGALCLSTIFLGVFSGHLMGRNGLIWALLFCTLFVFLVVFLINSAYFKQLSLNSFNTLYLIPVLFGGIGGIIGVNVKK